MAKTILVVDDSATMRRIIELTLCDIPNIDIVQAKDGVEALERLESLAPSVILTDVNMPNMDGFELLETIRNGSEHETTPVIIITTRGDAADVEKGMALGATAYISKPIDGPKLTDTVKALLK